MRGQHFLELARRLGELSASLGAGESRLAAFGEADLQRRVAAKLRQIVVGPGDGRNAEAGFHSQKSPGSLCLGRSKRSDFSRPAAFAILSARAAAWRNSAPGV